MAVEVDLALEAGLVVELGGAADDVWVGGVQADGTRSTGGASGTQQKLLVVGEGAEAGFAVAADAGDDWDDDAVAVWIGGIFGDAVGDGVLAAAGRVVEGGAPEAVGGEGEPFGDVVFESKSGQWAVGSGQLMAIAARWGDCFVI